jgi:hypothetical protein
MKNGAFCQGIAGETKRPYMEILSRDFSLAFYVGIAVDLEKMAHH